jgi:hypothetical protein
MLWKRTIVAWMTLLALVFASAGASARTDVSPKPHVRAIDLVAAICIEASGLASAGGHQENWVPVTTETSDVPDAARGAASGASSAVQGARLSMQLAAEEAAGAVLPKAITGYTRHGLNQAISRDGVGVATRAIADAFKNPISIAGQSGGRFVFTGQNAVVVVNAEGRVISTWATNSAGVRAVVP